MKLLVFGTVSVAIALSTVGGPLTRGRTVGSNHAGVYTPSSENFANPERGFYRASAPFFLGTQRAPLTTAVLQDVRNEGLSPYRAAYVFDEFRDTPLSQAALDAMTADFANVRAAGLTIIPRIKYSFPCAGANEPCSPGNFGVTDIPLAMVLNHIASLTPVFQANADVIAMLEMGFVARGASGKIRPTASLMQTLAP